MADNRMIPQGQPCAIRNPNVEPQMLLLVRQWLRQQGLSPDDVSNENILATLRQTAQIRAFNAAAPSI